MRVTLASRCMSANSFVSASPRVRSVSRKVHTMVTFIGVVDAVTWRNSCRVAVSAQCRSSSTTTTADCCDAATSSSVAPSSNNSRSVSGSATRSVSVPISGTRRASALRCAERNPPTHEGSPKRTRHARASIHGWYATPRSSSECPNRTTAPSPCARRADWAVSDVLPIPASPAMKTTWHRCDDFAALVASSNTSSSAARPKNPNRASVAVPASRPGNGTEPSTTAGSHTTSTTSTGSGRPLNSIGPTSTKVWAA